MMNVLVNGRLEQLALVDANGNDWVNDFIGNTGALADEIVWDEEKNAFVAEEDAFDFWKKAVETQQLISNRIEEMNNQLGADAVSEALEDTDASDIPDEQANILAALDELEEAHAGK